MLDSLSAVKLPQLDGIVVLNKPSGPTSSQCLSVLKRQGQRKIGHAGTLDPMASGVLPVLLGQATKLSAWLLHASRKVYSGQLRLGMTTDTWDMEGKTLDEKPWESVSCEDVAAGVAAWLELDEQEIPAYSAVKHGGQPLYKLARKGQHAPQKVKPVKVFEADMLDVSMPYVSFRVACASGTYIRSLAHSLGQRLGCGAVLCRLTREYSHPFDLSQAVDLEELRRGLRPEHVLPMWAAAPRWPRIEIDAAEYGQVRNGVAIPAGPDACGHVFLCRDGTPAAVARAQSINGHACYVIERGLWNL